MVIFKINKGMTKEEYLNYSKHLVQEYEWCKGRDKCMVVPEYVDVFFDNTTTGMVTIDKNFEEDMKLLLGKEHE